MTMDAYTFEMQSLASSLFASGWRAEDEELIEQEYQMTEEEAAAIADLLSYYEMG